MSTAEQEKEGFWTGAEEAERHQWDTAVGFLQERALHQRKQGAGLSQQVRVGGGQKRPEESSENGFSADGRKNRDGEEQGRTLRGTFSHRVQPNVVLLPGPTPQPQGCPRYLGCGQGHLLAIPPLVGSPRGTARRQSTL